VKAQYACALMLLEKGADPTIPISEGDETALRLTVLLMAIGRVRESERMIDVIDALIACDIDINEPILGNLECSAAELFTPPPVVQEMLKSRAEGRYVTAFEKTADRRAADMAATLGKGIPEPLKPAPRIRIQKPGGKRLG
jgi:hypothetical protein